MSSPGCLYWRDPQSHQTSSSNVRRDPCLEARSPGSGVNRIFCGRTSSLLPKPASTPPEGCSDSQCKLPFTFSKPVSRFPSQHGFLSDLSHYQAPMLLLAPNMHGHPPAPFSRVPLFSRWASNHPSKPQADGATLESFPGALAEPTASSAPSLGFYCSTCPCASIVPS